MWPAPALALSWPRLSCTSAGAGSAWSESLGSTLSSPTPWHVNSKDDSLDEPVLLLESPFVRMGHHWASSRLPMGVTPMSISGSSGSWISGGPC
eukprot:7283610-Pyramimonas_sp.AAC.1